MNDPILCAAAQSLASCRVPSPTDLSVGAECPETIRSAKGRFPADLNQLRGQLSLEASVGDPVVCALECNASVILIAACDDKDFYGIWKQGQWTPAKADQLYGSAFSALVQEQLNGAGATADIWAASFWAFSPSAVVTTAAAAAEPTPVVGAAAAAPAKKKVVRKRPLAIPVVTPSTTEEPVQKKAAPEEDDHNIDL